MAPRELDGSLSCDAKYLSRALAIGESPRVELTTRTPTTVTDADLRLSSVVLVNDVQTPDDLADRLTRFVAAGGGQPGAVQLFDLTGILEGRESRDERRSDPCVAAKEMVDRGRIELPTPGFSVPPAGWPYRSAFDPIAVFPRS